MSRRRGPRRLGESLPGAVARSAPATALARVEAVWPAAVGAAVAAEATPVAERDGVLDVSCRSAAWANELDLLSEALIARVNAELGAAVINSLRVRADGERHS